MSHLSPERLAALSDDTPTPVEAAHITTCDFCSGELAAQRKLSRLAAAAQVLVSTPVSNFDALVPRLRAEGLVAEHDRGAASRRWAIRIAAGVTLVAGGVVGGRVTATRELPMLPKPQPGETSATAASVESAKGFKTTDEAMLAMSAAQQTYQTAAAFIAAQDTSSHFIGLNQNTYRTRLAALDEIAAATRAALYRAPQDPVLNQYYLGTLSEREATLTQLRQAIPVTSRMRSY